MLTILEVLARDYHSSLNGKKGNQESLWTSLDASYYLQLKEISPVWEKEGMRKTSTVHSNKYICVMAPLNT